MADPAPPRAPAANELEAAFRRVSAAALERAEGDAREPAFCPAGAAGVALRPFRDAPRPLDDALGELLDEVLPNGMRTDHPRFFAFIPSPANPVAWVAEAVTAIHNQHAGADLQSEGASAIERGLIRFLCEATGFPATSGGLFTSGGSLANLTALTVARDRMLSEEERPRAVAYVSSQTHSSIAKALRIIGVADRNIRTVPADARLRMDPAALAQMTADDRAAGLAPFVVAASAGTTNTGAIDPLAEIATLCRRDRLWMHVDGAYGASVLLCRERRGLLAGVEQADSLSWDAHKWLFQTYGCGMVLVRDQRLLAESFRMGRDYLRDGDNGSGEANFWDMGPELTRPARATRLWLTLQVMGLDAVGAAIDHGFRIAQAAEAAVRRRRDWEISSPAGMAILAFRFAPDGLPDAEADALNALVARRILDDGYAVVGTTRLDGRTVLRMCTINPRTTVDDVEGVIERLDAFAREELAAPAIRAAS